MDFLPQSQYICAMILFAIFFMICIKIMWSNKNDPQSKQPPQPHGAWPIIGHLHLLNSRQLHPQQLGDMADKYGPTFLLRLGMRRMLIISSSEGVKDCFSTNDKTLASRPRHAIGEHLGYDYSLMVFAPYGSYWRSVRKIATIELLSNTRLDMLKHVRFTEIDTCMKQLHQLWVENNQEPIKINIKKLLGDLTYNIVTRMVVGKRYFGFTHDGCDEAEVWKFRNAVEQFFKLLSEVAVSDMFPFLKSLDLNGKEAKMKAAAGDLETLLTNLLEEHRQRNDKDRDFMDIMISTMQDPEFSDLDADRVIKSTSLAMILGGTDNTTAITTIALAALLKNQDLLRKVQDELETHIGKNRVVKESDIKKLSYLHAVVKETFRLYPSIQLNVPHEATEDCQIQGFKIQAGTQILVNIWKLHRDPSVWSDPLEFKPERFMSGNVDVRGQHFGLIPFGSGRRACPGISFALQVIHLTLARLIQGFEIKMSSDGSVETMSHYLEQKSTNLGPLEIVLTPRLPMNLYT